MPDTEEHHDDPKTAPPLVERSPVLRAIRRSHDLIREARVYDRVLPAAFLVGVLLALVWYGVFAAPPDFTVPAIVKVSPGMTLTALSEEMQAEHIVRSAWTLKLIMRLIGANRSVEAGSYFFSAPQDMVTVALRLARGDFELIPTRVTIAEGENVQAIAAQLAKKLAPFDEQGFLNAALPMEGYLYPDTYYFLPGEDPTQITGAMGKDFEIHTAPLAPLIQTFGKPLSDDVIMASILVKEATTDTDRRMVAGILWRRIQIGMPLQVDATFSYILDKSLTQLTGADIHTDSPYNTYLHTGLPPTPIGSPGAEALQEAVTPTPSHYLYYLSDKNGVMHFSATYAQQLAKIRLYYGS